MKNARPIPIRPVFNRTPAGVHLERAAFAAFMARSGRHSTDAGEVCRSIFPDDEVAPLLLANRAAVTAATTTGWAGELAGEAVGSYLASLNPFSAVSRLIPLGLSITFDGNTEVILPRRTNAPAVLPWVGEGGAIALRAAPFTAMTAGPPRKFGIILALSRELSKRSAAQSIFQTLLREDAAKSLDAAYFSTTAATSDAPAGLLNGVSPITATAGGGVNARDSDLAALAAAVLQNGSGEVIFVTSPSRAFKFNLAAGDLDITVIGSTAVPADRIIAVDPLSLYHGFGTEPEIDASIETTLHMSDSPTNIGTVGSPNVVAAPSQSMFQTDYIAMRLLADVAFGKRRADAVAYVDGATW